MTKQTIPIRILDLSLTYHWYDEIAAGKKWDEYREDTLFYRKRFMACYNKNRIYCNQECSKCPLFLDNSCGCKDYDAIRFHRGQGSKTTMLVKWKGLCWGIGRTEWGAPTDHEVWIIKLGNKL